MWLREYTISYLDYGGKIIATPKRTSIGDLRITVYRLNHEFFFFFLSLDVKIPCRIARCLFIARRPLSFFKKFTNETKKTFSIITIKTAVAIFCRNSAPSNGQFRSNPSSSNLINNFHWRFICLRQTPPLPRRAMRGDVIK